MNVESLALHDSNQGFGAHCKEFYIFTNSSIEKVGRNENKIWVMHVVV